MDKCLPFWLGFSLCCWKVPISINSKAFYCVDANGNLKIKEWYLAIIFCLGLLLTRLVSLSSHWPQWCGQQQSLAQHHPDLASSIFLISNQKPGPFPLPLFSSFLSFLPLHCLLKSPTSYTLWYCLVQVWPSTVSHFDIIAATFSFYYHNLFT